MIGDDKEINFFFNCLLCIKNRGTLVIVYSVIDYHDERIFGNHVGNKDERIIIITRNGKINMKI